MVGKRRPTPIDPVTEVIDEPANAPTRAHDISITVLSTSKAEVGVGEWGFCALVEVDGERILFDAGAKQKTVLRNAEADR